MPRTSSAIQGSYRVTVSNEQRSLKLDKRKLIEAVRTVLRDESVTEAEISIALLDDESIHRVNLEFLNHNYPPDVLSFVLEESGGDTDGSGRRRGAGKILQGEILIGVEEAMRVAARYDWPAEHEVLLYLVHGLLHLCGYDDLTSSEKRIMRRREKELLGTWDLVPPYLRRKPPARPKRGRAT